MSKPGAFDQWHATGATGMLGGPSFAIFNNGWGLDAVASVKWPEDHPVIRHTCHPLSRIVVAGFRGADGIALCEPLSAAHRVNRTVHGVSRV